MRAWWFFFFFPTGKLVISKLFVHKDTFQASSFIASKDSACMSSCLSSSCVSALFIKSSRVWCQHTDHHIIACLQHLPLHWVLRRAHCTRSKLNNWTRHMLRMIKPWWPLLPVTWSQHPRSSEDMRDDWKRNYWSLNLLRTHHSRRRCLHGTSEHFWRHEHAKSKQNYWLYTASTADATVDASSRVVDSDHIRKLATITWIIIVDSIYTVTQFVGVMKMTTSATDKLTIGKNAVIPDGDYAFP